MPCECYLRFNWYSPTKCLYCFELDHNAVDEVGSWELGYHCLGALQRKKIQKSESTMEVGGWDFFDELYPNLFGICGIFFNFAKPLRP